MKMAAATVLTRTSKEKAGTCFAIAFGCFTTILAQIESRLSFVFTIFWFAFVLYLAVNHRSRARFVGISFFTVAFAVILLIYCSACYLATDELGFLTGFFQLYLKCLLMYLVGFLAAPSSELKTRQWNTVLVVYVVAVCIYVVWALINYFPGFDAWLSSEVYLFEKKNSLGQIAGVAVIILLAMSFEQNSPVRGAALWLFAAGLVLCILLVQCRTAVLACCVALVCLLVLMRKKWIIAALIVLFVLCIAVSSELQDILSHAFFLDKYEGADANTMSSGRLGYWAEALDAVKGSELIGIGDYYVDNMYIAVYVNLGIIGFVLFMCLWVSRIIVNFKRILNQQSNSNNGVLYKITACLVVFYLVESLLEAYPPFGPGTCSFMFWMLCGYLDGIESQKTGMEATGKTLVKRTGLVKEVSK